MLKPLQSKMAQLQNLMISALHSHECLTRQHH